MIKNNVLQYTQHGSFTVNSLPIFFFAVELESDFFDGTDISLRNPFQRRENTARSKNLLFSPAFLLMGLARAILVQMEGKEGK